MAEMAYIQASFTVTPVAVQGQAGEVQGEQRDAGAKEQTQTHKRDVISLLRGLTALDPTPQLCSWGKAPLMKNTKLP